MCSSVPDYIARLPNELAVHVFSYLSAIDLSHAAAVCKDWRRIITEDDTLWKYLCQLHCISWDTLPPAPSNNSQMLNNTPWRALFFRYQNVMRNWKKGSVNKTYMLVGHTEQISHIKLVGDLVITASNDHTIFVWSLLSGQHLGIICVHLTEDEDMESDIDESDSNSEHEEMDVQFQSEENEEFHKFIEASTEGQFLISGAEADSVFNLWDLGTFECIYTIPYYPKSVDDIAISKNWLVTTGSRDFTIRVWDLEAADEVHLLDEHDVRINELQFDGVHILSGDFCGCVKLWGVASGVCLQTYDQGDDWMMEKLMIDPVHDQVISFSQSFSPQGEPIYRIYVYSMVSSLPLHTFAQVNSVSQWLLRDNLLITVEFTEEPRHPSVKVYDIVSGQYLHTLFTSEGEHMALKYCQNGFLVAYYPFDRFKIWNIHNCNLVANVHLDLHSEVHLMQFKFSPTSLVLLKRDPDYHPYSRIKMIQFDFDAEYPD